MWRSETNRNKEFRSRTREFQNWSGVTAPVIAHTVDQTKHRVSVKENAVTNDARQFTEVTHLVNLLGDIFCSLSTRMEYEPLVVNVLTVRVTPYSPYPNENSVCIDGKFQSRYNNPILDWCARAIRMGRNIECYNGSSSSNQFIPSNL